MPKDNYDLPIPKFGSNATKFPPNVFGTQTPLDLTDPQYLKNIVSNGNYAKGQEGNATADGLYARSDIENENAKILFINGFLADRIFPRGLFAYSSSAEYYQHSPTFEISTGKIFQSLQDSNIGKPFTDTAWWLDTGQTIQTLYTNITNLQNKTLPTATTTTQGVSFLNKKIELSWASITSLNYSAGVMNFDDETGQALLIASTINFATNGLNGLDTGVLSANSSYYIFAIYNPTTKISGMIASASKTLPTLPSGFTKKEYRGACMTNGSSQIRSGTYLYKKDGTYHFTYDNLTIDAFHQNDSGAFQNYTLTIPILNGLVLIGGQVNSDVQSSYPFILLYQKDRPGNAIVAVRSADSGSSLSQGYIPLVNTNQIAKEWGGVGAWRVWQYTLGWVDYLI